jgi:hypothetical protein
MMINIYPAPLADLLLAITLLYLILRTRRP